MILRRTTLLATLMLFAGSLLPAGAAPLRSTVSVKAFEAEIEGAPAHPVQLALPASPEAHRLPGRLLAAEAGRDASPFRLGGLGTVERTWHLASNYTLEERGAERREEVAVFARRRLRHAADGVAMLRYRQSWVRGANDLLELRIEGNYRGEAFRAVLFVEPGGTGVLAHPLDERGDGHLLLLVSPGPIEEGPPARR